ncbi:hypothetical protein L1987_52413 [Smallanthus sonchifolius]|uniref:Uncharacterized protein n=1 Tax=Smallanthus sonchifolius TaxID=185202 RepID=A0ACB9ETM7_9ASTR|nr:hypothetical protein L1987_52413 [Smallanthus sonchifolius]
MRSITISSSNGFTELMKVKVAARHVSLLFLFWHSYCHLCLFLLLLLLWKVSTTAHQLVNIAHSWFALNPVSRALLKSKVFISLTGSPKTMFLFLKLWKIMMESETTTMVII